MTLTLQNKLVTRQATTADCNLLHDIGSRSYRDHFTSLWTPEGLEAYIHAQYGLEALEQSLGCTNSTWLIASTPQDNQAIGFAKINWNKAIPIGEGVGAELEKIYFLKTATGKRFGEQLLRNIESVVRLNNHALLWLDALQNNMSALRFYQRHGFEKVGAIPFRTDIHHIGMFVLMKAL